MENFASVKIKQERLFDENPDDYKNPRSTEESKDTTDASKKN